MKFASFALVIAIAAAVSAWSDAHADLRTGGENAAEPSISKTKSSKASTDNHSIPPSGFRKERRRKQMHLYRKRKSFRDESKQTLAELRYFR